MADILKVFADEGLRGALRQLNSEVAHRYTAAYELRDEKLYPLYVFDKLDPEVRQYPEGEARHTYCDLTLLSKAPVRIVDASNDELAKKHLAFAHAKSYCGAPLRNTEKLMWGTLCHYDAAPQIINDTQWQRLLGAADFLGVELFKVRPPEDLPEKR